MACHHAKIFCCGVSLQLSHTLMNHKVCRMPQHDTSNTEKPHAMQLCCFRLQTTFNFFRHFLFLGVFGERVQEVSKNIT